ncbi:hypothetical protein HPB47_003916 [Ixodes persulcatus]|uniref:Uncharacterized protein n=1 Tax=Ixodes persulcatus TaxID=34615 RepID=A0AC60PHQ0_IXOPE|nr:hypothetical protein HPB47_003916 [Ixodes persulcatus]
MALCFEIIALQICDGALNDPVVELPGFTRLSAAPPPYERVAPRREQGYALAEPTPMTQAGQQSYGSEVGSPDSRGDFNAAHPAHRTYRQRQINCGGACPGAILPAYGHGDANMDRDEHVPGDVPRPDMKLKNIPMVEHAIYADHIAIWCKSGSDGKVEKRLDAAADITAEYARS